MKRFAALAIMMAILVGLLPAGATERGEDPATWRVLYSGETGLAGYMDMDGNWVIPPQFVGADSFDETGHAVVTVEPEGGGFEGRRCGLIDATGAYTAEPIYLDIWIGFCYGGGRTFRAEDGTYGIMEADGTVRVPCVQEVDDLGAFTCGVAFYRLGEKEGLIDSQGNKLTDAIYDTVYVHELGWVEIRNEGKRGVMTLDGREVIPPTYDDVSDFSISRADLLGVRMKDKWGLVSLQTGELVLPCAFDNTDEANVALALGVTDREEIFSGCVRRSQELGLLVEWLEPGIVLMRRYGTDRMVLVKDGVAALYGLDGTAYTDYIFDVIGNFDVQGHAVAMKMGRWGQIDLNGNTVVDFIYTNEEEAKGAVEVHFVSKWTDDSAPYALARRDGAILTEYKYWSGTSFANGFALVSNGEGWAYIGTDGKELTDFRYDSPLDEQFGSTLFGEDGLAIVQHKEGLRRNVLDSTGRELLQKDYYKVWRAGCGLFGFSDGLGGPVGFIDSAGKVVIEPQFSYHTSPKGHMQGNVFGEDTGLASVWSNGGWITIDTQGNRVTEIPEAGDKKVDYREGLTCSNHYGPGTGASGGPWGFQNEVGEWTISPLFDTEGHFDHGYAAVRSMGRYGLLKNPLIEDEETHKVSDWAAPEIAAATAAGYVTPRCSTYQTHAITRLQFAELAVNYLEKRTGEVISPAPTDTFTDTEDETALKAAAAGIVQGIGEDRFDADGLLTREQLATMLWRAMSKAGATAAAPADLTTYTDGAQVSDWAADSLSALVGLGVMEGTGANALSPNASCTVEQAILLVYRAVK